MTALATKLANLPVSSSLAELPEPAGREARELGRALGVGVTIADWLLRRGHSNSDATRRFLEPRLAHLTTPEHMLDRSLAAERLARAVKSGERVIVFGDYDCDGITSTAIMTEILRALGGDAVPLLASRFAGGYGVSPQALERIERAGGSVVVTCDCGSSDHEALARLQARGADVIVIDHHLVPSAPLPALAFLNPHRQECGFPYKGLASCGLALSIGAALRATLGIALDLRKWLDLVAIGTIADVAPLDGDNRVLVRAGLGALAEARRPGVRALLELAKLDLGEPITSEDVAFRLAPRINAAGRMGSPDLALQLLLAQSAEEAQALAAELEQVSLARRSLQDQMLAEASEEIEREAWSDRPALVIGREGWNHGIVGIVAGRLATEYGRPVIALGFEAGRGRGSVRGPAGVPLHDLLERVQDVLLRFGGHQAAAGLEIELSRLPELRERFERECSNAIEKSAPRARDLTLVARLSQEDEPARVLADLLRLEPCGKDNPLPELLVEASVVQAREVKGGHLKLELDLPGGFRIAGFGVAMGARAGSLPPRVLVLGRLRADRWRGGNAVEIRVDEICELPHPPALLALP